MSAFIEIKGKAWSSIEVKQTKTGKRIGLLKASSSFKENDQWKSMYFDVTVFDENLMGVNVTKGDTVYIKGTLRTGEYTDKTGNLRTSLKVTANNINGIEAAPFKYPDRIVEQFHAKQPQKKLPDNDYENLDVPF